MSIVPQVVAMQVLTCRKAVNCINGCTTHPPNETNCVLDKMQPFTMDSEYEHHHHPDFDVVRSTQFCDDYTRGVRFLFSRDLSYDMCYSQNSGNLKGLNCVMRVFRLNSNKFTYFFATICTGLRSGKRATTALRPSPGTTLCPCRWF